MSQRSEPPVMTTVGDAYVFSWPGLPVRIEVDYFVETRGDLFAELTIADTLTDPPTLIHNSRLNLNAANTRSSLAKDLAAADASVPWAAKLEEVCFLSKRAYRQGEPSIRLCDVQADTGDRWLLRPYIEADQSSMSVIYADGGSGKSLLSLAMAVTLAGDDQLVGRRVGPPVTALYLDWEAGPMVQHQRLRAIAAGAGFADMPSTLYRRMRVPLTYAAPAIRRELDAQACGVVFVDSLGAAGDGPIEESATALATMRAMASFKRPIMAVHHMPKNLEGKRGAGAMFGSVYYANAVRVAWELRGEKNENTQTIAVGLVNTKNNNGVLERRHAYEVTFRNDSRGDPVTIGIRSVDAARVADLHRDVPLGDQIMELLRGGALERATIAGELGKTPSHIGKELTNLRERGKVIQIARGEWGLAAQ